MQVICGKIHSNTQLKLIKLLLSISLCRQRLNQDEVSWIEWKKALNDALVESKHLYTVTEKVTKIYGAGAADVKRITVQD